MRKMILLVVLMLAVLSGTAAAQDFPVTFCGDLAEADCAILTDSAAAMRDLESAAFDFQLDFAVSNIPDFPGGAINFRLTGDGAYAIEPGTLNALTMNPAQMMQNMDELSDMMADILTAISADANLMLFLPQNLPDMDRPLPERVGVSMRLVDGVGYINLDKLAELDTSGDMPRGWMGIDLVDFFNEALAAQGETLGTMPMQGMNMDMMGMFADPDFMRQYMTVTRGAGTTIDGQDAAVFETAIDLGALFGSEDFQQTMREQIETMMAEMGESGQSLSEREWNQVMALYSILFDGFDLRTTQTIGLTDHYVHTTSMTLDWALDFSGMAGAFGGAGATDMPAINLSIGFQGNLSQFNSAPTITAPEGALVIPVKRLFERGF